MEHERGTAVARVTLCRPERRNAFDREMIAELATAFSRVGDARAVLLGGDGPAFCAGADVEWMRASAGLSREDSLAEARQLAAMLDAVDRCPAPVVCRIHGAAFGGALGLVACTDVAVAAEDAAFAFSETKLGLVPAVISPYVLRRIGTGSARRLFLTGERFGAEQALRMGLVHEVAADVDAACQGVLDELLAAGPEAVRAAKRLVLDAPLDGEETARRIAERRASPEAQEGLRAFLEKRAPSWRSAGSS